MAKSSLPSVDVVETKTAPPAGPLAFTVVQQTTERVEGYIPRRVDVKLARHHGLILRDKLQRLLDTGAKTADGKFVTNKMQAVRWILENEVK